MLEHFVQAQDGVYATALGELTAGRKQSHWMWFIFPQIAGLGFSPMSQRYALHSLAEAQTYLSHPLLGPRLRDCIGAVLTHPDRSAHAIFGSPDDMKFQSCMTLFGRAAPHEDRFRQALDTFFDGREDPNTLARI